MSIIPFFSYIMKANPTLPKFYWDVKSQEQLIMHICCYLDSLKDHVNEMGEQVNVNTEDIERLKEMFEQFQQSGFDDYYAEQIERWIEENLPWLWETFASMVFFGLTSDGYFCAYVPESWEDIVFDTGAVYGTEQYGRLILRYITDGTGVIDNTDPYYPLPDSEFSKILERISDMQGEIDSIISSGGSGYVLPEATDERLGGVYLVSDGDFAEYMEI